MAKGKSDQVPAICEIFTGWAVGNWGWCLHCGRAYQVGEFRQVGKLQYCPYSDCDGDAVLDCWHWEQVRDANPSYPEIPLRDVFYSLYG